MVDLSSYRGAGHLPLPSPNARTNRPRVLLTPPEIASPGLRPGTESGAFRATAAWQRRVEPRGGMAARRMDDSGGMDVAGFLLTPGEINAEGAGWGIRPVAHSLHAVVAWQLSQSESQLAEKHLLSRCGDNCHNLCPPPQHCHRGFGVLRWIPPEAHAGSQGQRPFWGEKVGLAYPSVQPSRYQQSACGRRRSFPPKRSRRLRSSAPAAALCE